MSVPLSTSQRPELEPALRENDHSTYTHFHFYWIYYALYRRFSLEDAMTCFNSTVGKNATENELQHCADQKSLASAWSIATAEAQVIADYCRKLLNEACCIGVMVDRLILGDNQEWAIVQAQAWVKGDLRKIFVGALPVFRSGDLGHTILSALEHELGWERQTCRHKIVSISANETQDQLRSTFPHLVVVLPRTKDALFSDICQSHHQLKIVRFLVKALQKFITECPDRVKELEKSVVDCGCGDTALLKAMTEHGDVETNIPKVLAALLPMLPAVLLVLQKHSEAFGASFLAQELAELDILCQLLSCHPLLSTVAEFCELLFTKNLDVAAAFRIFQRHLQTLYLGEEAFLSPTAFRELSRFVAVGSRGSPVVYMQQSNSLAIKAGLQHFMLRYPKSAIDSKDVETGMKNEFTMFFKQVKDVGHGVQELVRNVLADFQARLPKLELLGALSILTPVYWTQQSCSTKAGMAASAMMEFHAHLSTIMEHTQPLINASHLASQAESFRAVMHVVGVEFYSKNPSTQQFWQYIERNTEFGKFLIPEYCKLASLMLTFYPLEEDSGGVSEEQLLGHIAARDMRHINVALRISYSPWEPGEFPLQVAIDKYNSK